MQPTPLKEVLKNNQEQFSPVVNFEPTKDRLLLLDFTSANTELNHDLLNDIKAFSTWVSEKLNAANALYGIGGYNEHRTVYHISNIFDAKKPGDEPRRLHLGTDIWGKPQTAVMAPLDGIVHSFAFNNRSGDYGATIILSHFLAGISFYTLYGHLSLNSIKNIQEGDHIGGGDGFAEFGIPSENGQWPPHLHFQIINEIENYKGDYPGVCKFSEKEKWLANSPDPDIILQFNRFL